MHQRRMHSDARVPANRPGHVREREAHPRDGDTHWLPFVPLSSASLSSGDYLDHVVMPDSIGSVESWCGRP